MDPSTRESTPDFHGPSFTQADPRDWSGSPTDPGKQDWEFSHDPYSYLDYSQCSRVRFPQGQCTSRRELDEVEVHVSSSLDARPFPLPGGKIKAGAKGESN